VLARAENSASGMVQWECACNCGRSATIKAQSLRDGTQSCGCLRVEAARSNGRSQKVTRIADMRTKRAPRPAPEKYLPIDEILSGLRIRTLRVLQRFDWIATETLFDILGLQEGERNACVTRIRFLAKTGCVEVDRSSWPYQYRITTAGRAALRAALNDYDQRLGEGVAA